MKSLLIMVSIAAALAACAGEPAGDADASPMDATTDVEVGGDASDADVPVDLAPEVPPVVAPTSWSADVETVSFVSEGSIAGDMEGAVTLGGTWGYQKSATCWLLPEAAPYGGPARLYAPSPVPPQSSQLKVTLTPAEGVDLNLVVMTMDLGTFWVPPTVQLSSCYGARAGGPGEAEEKTVFTITDVSNVLVMVVAPEGTEGGAFELSFLLEK
jgi:hypothetical protein